MHQEATVKFAPGKFTLQKFLQLFNKYYILLRISLFQMHFWEQICIFLHPRRVFQGRVFQESISMIVTL